MTIITTIITDLTGVPQEVLCDLVGRRQAGTGPSDQRDRDDQQSDGRQKHRAGRRWRRQRRRRRQQWRKLGRARPWSLQRTAAFRVHLRQTTRSREWGERKAPEREQDIYEKIQKKKKNNKNQRSSDLTSARVHRAVAATMCPSVGGGQRVWWEGVGGGVGDWPGRARNAHRPQLTRPGPHRTCSTDGAEPSRAASGHTWIAVVFGAGNPVGGAVVCVVGACCARVLDDDKRLENT